MASSGRRMSDSDREFVRAAWPGVSATKIAARIGFSKTAVIAYLKREGLWELRDEPGNDAPATLGPEDGRQDTLGRLLELRDALKLALVGADAKTIPSVAREYRATIAEIDRMQAEERGEDADPFAELLHVVTSKLSA